MYFYCCDYIYSLFMYDYPDRFFRAFSSVVRQMPGWNPQRRGTARTPLNFCLFCVLLCSMFFCVLCIVCFVSSVLFLCICVMNYCHRVATQLQLSMSYIYIYISTPPMGRTACREPQYSYTSTPTMGRTACTEPQYSYTSTSPMDRTACTEPQ
jgi:hypothetical protein